MRVRGSRIMGPIRSVPATVHSAPVPAARARLAAAEENVNEEKVCRSPVAGVVIKVNVEPGQAIQANDLMMVLEAMKMETNVTAPVAGKVKRSKGGAGRRCESEPDRGRVRMKVARMI